MNSRLESFGMGAGDIVLQDTSSHGQVFKKVGGESRAVGGKVQESLIVVLLADDMADSLFRIGGFPP